MSDSIGVLGRASATTVGTTTVFTCPAGFAAKGRIMFSGQNAAVGNFTLQVIVAGLTVMNSGNVAVNDYIFSIQTAGLLSSGPSATAPTGVTAALTVAPALPIYYLNPGDTIQYVIGTNAPLNFQMMFVGTLVDLND